MVILWSNELEVLGAWGHAQKMGSQGATKLLLRIFQPHAGHSERIEIIRKIRLSCAGSAEFPRPQAASNRIWENSQSYKIHRFIDMSPTGCLIKPKTGAEPLGKCRLKEGQASRSI